MRRALGCLLAGLLLLTGCSLFDGPEPDDAAQALARALTRRDVGDVAFSGTSGAGAQATLTKVLARMDDVPARVRAVDVQADGDTATGVLVWSWRVPGPDWVTRSTFDLRKRGDTWRPVWDVRLVHPRLKPGWSLRATDLLPTRGDIIGARGQHLVTNRSVVTYGFDKTAVPAAQAPAQARRLAALVGIDPAAYADRVRKAGAKAYVPAVVLRNGDPGLPSSAAVAGIAGARATPGKLPLAPTRTFAAQLLGRVGQPTADMVKRAKGALSATDQVGIGGLEARYDARLRGRDGVRISLVDPDGEGRALFRAEPTAGRPLITTLDLSAQERAERALAGTTSPAALVAVRPSTGEIVAAANGPKATLNVATYGRYAPGSTFKVVSSLALLRAGITPDTVVDCPRAVTVDGKRFENYDDYPASALGRVTFRTAIANSCNTAVIGLRDKLSGDDLTDAAAALGLGVDHDTGFPAYFGQAPAAASETEGAADLIGQGKVLASPMAMAAVVASVASGRTVVPSLLQGVEPKASPGTPLTAKEASALRSLLRAVVTEGSGRLLADLPGPPAYAKTGTAEYGAATPPRTHAWMVAIHGDLAVAVLVGDGPSGSGTAGPILKDFFEGFA